MANLDVRGQALRGDTKVKVNFSSIRPLTPEMERALVRGMASSRLAVDRALKCVAAHIAVLKRPAPTPPADPDEALAAKVLGYHARLKDAGTYPRQGWDLYLDRLLRNLDLIRIGLNGDVVIADALADLLRLWVQRNRSGLNEALTAYTTVSVQRGDSGVKNVGQVVKTLTQPGVWKGAMWERLLGRNEAARTSYLEDLRETIAENQSTVQGYVRLKRIPLNKAGTLEQFGNDGVSFRQDDFRIDPAHRKSIHIDFALLTERGGEAGRRYLTRALVHEASHKFAGTADFAYSHDPAYKTQTPAQAVNNADSVAWVAVCLGEGASYKDAKDFMTQA